MKYLNLGCGKRFHSDWVNIDIVSTGPGVIAHDLSKGIPLPDSSCDVIYHSNMLEHLRCADAVTFTSECFRVLKPAGILRIAVPDLEQICRLYLQTLEAAVAGKTNSDHDYEWMKLELCDQFVRDQGGGGMLEFLRQDPLPNELFVCSRIGEEGRNLLRLLRNPRSATETKQQPPKLFRRLRNLPGGLRRRLVNMLLRPDELCALKIGRFRIAGEVHQWMYDRYSLAQLLKTAGFRDPVLSSASKSQIPDWAKYNLDTFPDGTTIKPDSLFMEAIKP